MSGRITQCLERLAKEGKRGLIAYTMAGDRPRGVQIREHAQRCVDWVSAGVDILEIGVPFTDPVADGKAIQAAHSRSLARGTKIRDVFALVRAIRELSSVPVVLMTYFNPVLQYGLDRVIRTMREYRVDGLLLVDCPPTEEPDLYRRLSAAGIDTILLIAPNTTERRIARLIPSARGFIYGLSLKGVTGSTLQDYDSVENMTGRIRAQSKLPIAVGFGIRHPRQLASLPSTVNAVVVGSRLAELCAQTESFTCDAAIELIEQFRLQL